MDGGEWGDRWLRASDWWADLKGVHPGPLENFALKVIDNSKGLYELHNHEGNPIACSVGSEKDLKKYDSKQDFRTKEF